MWALGCVIPICMVTQPIAHTAQSSVSRPSVAVGHASQVVRNDGAAEAQNIAAAAFLSIVSQGSLQEDILSCNFPPSFEEGKFLSSNASQVFGEGLCFLGISASSKFTSNGLDIIIQR